MTARCALAGLSLGLAGCAAAGAAPPDPGPLRVLVYNIHAGQDVSRASNLQRVADLVLENKADLVLLQEVDRGTERSGGVDQVAELARLTGYHAAYGKTIDFQGGAYGVAILARWRISRDSLTELPVAEPGESYEARGVLHTVVEAPGGAIHVLNTHLDASREDGYRRQQVAELLRIADQLRSTGEHVLLGGDFNATPESAVAAMVEKRGWRDAWVGCGSGEGFTFPADTPRRRIDYLFLPDGLRCLSATVIPSQASDHRPVLVTVSYR